MALDIDYSERLLKSLTLAHSPSGFEGPVTQIIEQELSPLGGLISRDNLGGITCEFGPKDAPKVLVCSHQDEVGFRIQHITPDGFLHFLPVGGWWEHTLLSQKVSIRTAEGHFYSGIIGSKPVHFLSPAQRKGLMPMDSMFIDIGATSKAQVEQEFNIQIGDPITPQVEFERFPNDRYVSKAFDNRVGVAAMIEVGRNLSTIEKDLPVRLVLGATVQEEVGLRGARVMAQRIAPDYAIILEGPPADDTPGFNPDLVQGGIGRGCQIRLQDRSAILDPTLSNNVIQLAKEKAINLQIAMRNGGGTDAGAVHQSGHGVPCVAFGVPSRYIHTHHSMIDIRDYQEMIRLTTESILNFPSLIDPNTF